VVVVVQDGADGAEEGSDPKDDEEEKTEDANSGEALSADESDEDEESDITNTVLAQFEKVTRSRNKWKCTLKDGVMHIDGREYLFSMAFGEMQF
jgi:transcription initiation factor TFIIA large subunit